MTKTAIGSSTSPAKHARKSSEKTSTSCSFTWTLITMERSQKMTSVVWSTATSLTRNRTQSITWRSAIWSSSDTWWRITWKSLTTWAKSLWTLYCSGKNLFLTFNGTMVDIYVAKIVYKHIYNYKYKCFLTFLSSIPIWNWATCQAFDPTHPNRKPWFIVS